MGKGDTETLKLHVSDASSWCWTSNLSSCDRVVARACQVWNKQIIKERLVTIFREGGTRVDILRYLSQIFVTP